MWWKLRQKFRFDEKTGEIKLPFKHIKFPQEYWLDQKSADDDRVTSRMKKIKSILNG
jgi:hypothetical protein